jgi:hypothetical protein
MWAIYRVWVGDLSRMGWRFIAYGLAIYRVWVGDLSRMVWRFIAYGLAIYRICLLLLCYKVKVKVSIKGDRSKVCLFLT